MVFSIFMVSLNNSSELMCFLLSTHFFIFFVAISASSSAVFLCLWFAMAAA